MKLRTLFLSLFFLLLVFFTLVLVAVKNGVVVRSFSEIEQSLARNDVWRVTGALQQEEAALRLFATDWGMWDDTYAFVQNGNQEFIDSNLPEDTFYTAKIDLIYFVALSGKIVWGRIFDTSQGKDVSLRIFPPEVMSPDSLVLKHPDQEVGSRLILTQHGPMLIAAIDLQPTMGKGKSRGTLIVGRFLNDAILARLAKQTKESFRIWPLAGSDMASELQDIVHRLGGESEPLLVEVDASLLHIYTTYDDKPDKPGLLIRVTVARDMMSQVTASLTVAGYLFWGAGLLLLLAAFVGVRRWVLIPLQTMNGEIGRVRRENNLAHRLSDGGVYELRSLSQQFNTLLAQLEQDTISEKKIQYDLTRARQKAEQATAVKAKFLANMSHEIRTPMNGIIGLTELVQRTSLDEKQQSYLAKIANSSRLLLAIINDILDYSKIEAGKMVLEEVPFAIQEILDNLATSVSLSCEEKGLELIFDVEDVPAVLVGDPLRLGQVLINLASNAVKFTHTGQVVVKIRCHTDGTASDRVMLECAIQDSGIGMSAIQVKDIFKSFSQADASTSRKYGGSGLGLSISSYLVDKMGGDIWVDSSPDQGSTFSFTASLRRGESGRQQIASCTRCFKGLKALVVDDNPVVRRVHNHLLSSLGFTVHDVASGPQAVAWLLEQDGGSPCRVVLLDWQMTGMDGIGTAYAIQDLDLNTPPQVVMVSAHGRVEEIRALAAAGIAVHMLKPVTAGMLCDTLKGVLGIGTADEEEKPSSSLENRTILTGVKVLVVDDVDVNQLVAKELLEQAGCQVVLAANGLEAVALVRDAHPCFSLILMDIQMPDMDGYETTRHLRALPASQYCDFSTLPIVAMTANVVDGTVAKCLAVGMNDHLSKPIFPKTLLAMVEKWGRG